MCPGARAAPVRTARGGWQALWTGPCTSGAPPRSTICSPAAGHAAPQQQPARPPLRPLRLVSPPRPSPGQFPWPVRSRAAPPARPPASFSPVPFGPSPAPTVASTPLPVFSVPSPASPRKEPSLPLMLLLVVLAHAARLPQQWCQTPRRQMRQCQPSWYQCHARRRQILRCQTLWDQTLPRRFWQQRRCWSLKPESRPPSGWAC
mmetsp:Transcript_72769/g.168675  ORF Transcript_72769/g.168675 Transcript_72769/m.168675 type:complete len:204 (-) Transcript_72769:768-1379(-)